MAEKPVFEMPEETRSAFLDMLVEEKNCAAVVGSGDLMVLGTPVLAVLTEKLAAGLVAQALGEGSPQTSVGTSVLVEHLAPTVVGGRVRVEVTVGKVEGRQVSFDMKATDNAGPIARGTHVRVLVGRERFMEKAAARLTGAGA